MKLAPLRKFVTELPGTQWLWRAYYEHKVQTGRNWRFWGVFPSYEDALGATPKDHPLMKVGYDTPEIADKGREVYERMHQFDYPVLYWLHRFTASCLEGGCTVVDLGGHLGEKLRVFRQRWTPPPELSWIVCETSATVEAAAKLPDEDRPQGLKFTTNIAVLNGARVVLASGALQYLERNLWNLLDELDSPPDHLVLNKVPLASGSDFWTLQNAWQSILPYHVFNRDAFVGQLAKRGYTLLDEWAIPDYAVRIPLRPDLGTEYNSGLCFSRTTTP